MFFFSLGRNDAAIVTEQLGRACRLGQRIAVVACVFPSALALAQDKPVMGVGSCEQCHATEVKAWHESPHANGTFANLSHDKAPEYASAMGVTGNLETSMCADCHNVAPQGDAMRGATCEACHGPAGPEAEGWFKLHSDYGVAFAGEGSPIAQREQEDAAHREARLAKLNDAGMIRSDNLYEISKNCLGCHAVPNEKLVNAGHPTSKRFELVRWSQGVVRHNFALDQSSNAEAPSLWLNPIGGGERTAANRTKLMFVTGQLADLEFSLRERSKASKGDYSKLVNKRIDNAIDELEDLEHIDEVKNALAGVDGINKKRLKKFNTDDSSFYGSAADAVAEAAADFVKNHPDGDDLGRVKTPKRVEGDPYAP